MFLLEKQRVGWCFIKREKIVWLKWTKGKAKKQNWTKKDHFFKDHHMLTINKQRLFLFIKKKIKLKWCGSANIFNKNNATFTFISPALCKEVSEYHQPKKQANL